MREDAQYGSVLSVVVSGFTEPGIGPREAKAKLPSYLGSTFVQLQVAPKRRAFLVRSGDVEGLRDVLKAAATIWGGMRCPILPVEPDGTIRPLWLQIAELLQVVEVVDYTQDEQRHSAWSGIRTSRWPVIRPRPIEDGRFWHAHPLVSYTSDELNSMMFYLPKDQTLLALASIGDVVLEEERDLWERSGVIIRTNVPRIEYLRAQVEQRTVLEATAHFDVETVTVSPFMTSLCAIWIVDDPDDFNETLWFWNHRALRPRGYPEGVSVYTRLKDLTNVEGCSILLDRVRVTASTKPDIMFASLSVPVEGMEDAAERMALVPYRGDKISEVITDTSRDPSRDR